MAAKLCLGYSTLFMVMTLYLKVTIIISNKKSDEWGSKYSKFVYGALGLLFLTNTVWEISDVVVINKTFDKYV